MARRRAVRPRRTAGRARFRLTHGAVLRTAATTPPFTCAPPARGYGEAVSIYDIPVKTLAGEDSSLGAFAGKTLLVVNVASKCGLTPQYTALEELHARLAPRGFAVVGFPCNQFGGQEPGTAQEIEEFCSMTYGVTFPMFEKVEVNGPGRHPVYDALTAAPDASGAAGDIQWNFEKFVLDPGGSVVARFRPRTVPDAPEVLEVIEANLPA